MPFDAVEAAFETVELRGHVLEHPDLSLVQDSDVDERPFFRERSFRQIGLRLLLSIDAIEPQGEVPCGERFRERSAGTEGVERCDDGRDGFGERLDLDLHARRVHDSAACRASLDAMAPRNLPQVDLPAHIANEVTIELAKKVRLRPSGDGVFYAGKDGRFKVVDESQWQANVIGRGSPDRYHVYDRAVDISGCANDQRDLVAVSPTQTGAAARIAAIVANERGVAPVLRSMTARGRYGSHLMDRYQRGEITHEQTHSLLQDWDRRHCAEFSPKDDDDSRGTQRERIMNALRD